MFVSITEKRWTSCLSWFNLLQVEYFTRLLCATIFPVSSVAWQSEGCPNRSVERQISLHPYTLEPNFFRCWSALIMYKCGCKKNQDFLKELYLQCAAPYSCNLCSSLQGSYFLRVTSHFFLI